MPVREPVACCGDCIIFIILYDMQEGNRSVNAAPNEKNICMWNRIYLSGRACGSPSFFGGGNVDVMARVIRVGGMVGVGSPRCCQSCDGACHQGWRWLVFMVRGVVKSPWNIVVSSLHGYIHRSGYWHFSCNIFIFCFATKRARASLTYYISHVQDGYHDINFM